MACAIRKLIEVSIIDFINLERFAFPAEQVIRVYLKHTAEFYKS